MKDEERRQLKVEGVLSFLVLTGRGFTFSNRIESPYYIGQGKKLRNRLWGHAKRVGGLYYNFWNFFSALAFDDQKHRDELEGVLIAAMPTANGPSQSFRKKKCRDMSAIYFMRFTSIACPNRQGTDLLCKLATAFVLRRTSTCP
jgi:hypothetical protein